MKKIVIVFATLVLAAGCATQQALFHDAIQDRDFTTVRAFLSRGIALDKTHNSRLPLQEAIVFEDIDMLKLLLGSGANVNAKTTCGDTALHTACFMGKENVVKMLLAKGAEVNVHGEYGSTPLHEACASGNLRVVMQLLVAGAERDTEDKFGRKPIAYAAQWNRDEVGSFLGKPNKKLPQDDEIELIGIAFLRDHLRTADKTIPIFVSFNGRDPKDDTMKEITAEGWTIRKASSIPPIEDRDLHVPDLSDAKTGKRGTLLSVEIEEWNGDFEAKASFSTYRGPLSAFGYSATVKKQYGEWFIYHSGLQWCS